MIKFKVINNKVILSYTANQFGSNWVYLKLDESGSVLISKAFCVTKNELISPSNESKDYNPDAAVEFNIADKKQDYYCFNKDILSLNHDLYIHENINLEGRIFVAVRSISIFKKIDNHVSNSIYIGGDNENSIPESIFLKLLKNFPNTYELNKYASARISSILSSYLDTKDDYEEKYQKYLNKKVSKKGSNIQFEYSKIEVLKYESILEKLMLMLDAEESYTESQWQEELLQIILLLYPKYIYLFKEVPVRDTYSNKDRRIDYLLVDSSGNTDIIEIKKPFNKCIVTERTYRDNYIPLRELSGTVMQIEKYIFYLNKWGKKGEEKLTAHYKNELAENFKIKITNPSGLIIMGRTVGLSEEQIQDFEVIKRKYKNVIDIITYDDLISRLKFTIKQWEKTYNKAQQSNP